jgi:serine/threonine protein kinase
MSTTRFQPGEFLDGRMEIIKAVRGGVGEVYLCIDRHNDQPLALKRLQTRYAAMPRFREAFRREAQTWIDLGRHPNIVPCLVLQNIYDEPFLVLEWIFGPDGGEPDLGKLMRGQQLDLRAVIAMTVDVSRGLVHAASCVPSIVHCDLKPANILIGAQGEALITDFGLAKSAVDAAIPASEVAPQSDSELNPAAGGTPRYMAPEQWTGSGLDARTDVYALACIAFEALSGRPVYPGPALEDFRRQHLTAPAPVLDGPGASGEDGQFGALIARCLAKDKEARPTPSDLLSGLTNIHQRLFGEPPAQRTSVSAPSARDLNNRAVTFHSLGRAEEAVGLYRQALEMNPSYAFARSNLAATLMSLGRLDEAWSEVNRAIDDDPSGAEAYANRAGIHAVREEPAEALADFQRAIDRNPRLAPAHVGRAKVYHRTGRWEEALAEVEAATRIDPLDAAAWLAQGELLDVLGRSKDALESFSRAIEVGGGSAMAYLRRSLMYLGSGEERLAVEDLTAAIAQDTQLYPAYLLRAHAQRNLYQTTSDPSRGGNRGLRSRARRRFLLRARLQQSRRRVPLARPARLRDRGVRSRDRTRSWLCDGLHQPRRRLSGDQPGRTRAGRSDEGHRARPEQSRRVRRPGRGVRQPEPVQRGAGRPEAGTGARCRLCGGPLHAWRSPGEAR